MENESKNNMNIWNRLEIIEECSFNYSAEPREDIHYLLQRLNLYKEQARRAMVLLDHVHFRCQFPEEPCDWDTKAKEVSDNIGKLIVEDRSI